MSSSRDDQSSFVHGARELPDVTVESYNLEIRDEEGFIGDRASDRAFRAIFDEIRAKAREVGDDPFADESSAALKKKSLDRLLLKGDLVAAGIVHGAIEDFAQKLASVTRRYLRFKSWRDVGRIAIGGGFRQSRIGELVIGRAAIILKSERVKVDMLPLNHHPDEAALIGCARLVPSLLFEGFDNLIAVDVGGSNIRCGVVGLNTAEGADFDQAEVTSLELWRHAEHKPSREEAVDGLVKMVQRSVRKAKKRGERLAPFIGVGCPGLIQEKGTIACGAQNLLGNWSSMRFNLPLELRERVPVIGERDTVVVMHNDAMVQGLSEVPSMQDVTHWGVLTIGTGLGNASFTNRKPGANAGRQASS